MENFCARGKTETGDLTGFRNSGFMILVTFLILFSTNHLFAANIQEQLKNSQHQIVLRDGWDFYWEQLLYPQSLIPQESLKVSTGQAWNYLTLPDGSTLPAYGFATYRFELTQIPAGEYELSLRLAGSAFAIYIFPKNDPGHWQSIKSGDFTPSTMKPSRQYRVLPFSVTETSDQVILIQVANNGYPWGGLYHEPELARKGILSGFYLREGLVSFLAFGVFLSLFVYNVMMWSRRKEDFASLALSVTNVAAGLRMFASTPFCRNLLREEAYSWLLSVEYLSIPLGIGSLLIFLQASFGAERFPIWICILMFIDGLLLLLPILSGTDIFPQMVSIYQMTTLIHILAYCLINYQGLRKNAIGARFVMVGCLAISSAMVMDVIAARSSMQLPFSTPIAVVLFLILQSQVVAMRAAEKHKQVEKLSQKLLHEQESLLKAEKSAREQTQANLDLQERMRLEIETRFQLSSDAAHQINNPLNHLSFAEDGLKRNMLDLEALTHRILGEYPSEDVETRSVQEAYREHFNDMNACLLSMPPALRRISSAILQIRSLSGIDGYANDYIQASDILLHLKEKLELFESEEALHRIILIPFEGQSSSILSNIHVLTHVLHRLLGILLERTQGQLRVQIKGESNDRLLYSHMSGVIDMRATTVEKLERKMNHVLAPFGNIVTLILTEEGVLVTFFSSSHGHLQSSEALA